MVLTACSAARSTAGLHEYVQHFVQAGAVPRRGSSQESGDVRSFIALLLAVFALTGCDVHFTSKGTIASRAALPLEGCWLVHESRGEQHASPLPAPVFDEGFATEGVPSTVAIGCDGHQPTVVPVPRDGNVGNIVLAARDGT